MDKNVIRFDLFKLIFLQQGDGDVVFATEAASKVFDALYEEPHKNAEVPF